MVEPDSGFPTAILIGYWRDDSPPADYPRTLEAEEHYQRLREQETAWPDPRRFVDPNWQSAERQAVGDYLERGTLVNQYRGISPCRFCDQDNGSAELTDGIYCWPEGLAHYIWDHAVRLPQTFVTHILASSNPLREAPRPTFDHLGFRDRSWPGEELAGLMWMPDAIPQYGLQVDADIEWWREQSGWSGEAARL